MAKKVTKKTAKKVKKQEKKVRIKPVDVKREANPVKKPEAVPEARKAEIPKGVDCRKCKNFVEVKFYHGLGGPEIRNRCLVLGENPVHTVSGLVKAVECNQFSGG